MQQTTHPPGYFHRLSLRLAFTVGAAVTVLYLAPAFFIPTVPLWPTLPFGLATGFIAYLAAHRLLSARIELARSTLKAIRHHRFDNLEDSRLPHGDELNSLIWQVYRTGQTLEQEFQNFKKVESYRREFLGNVSHELKTPIFSIRGFAETLLGEALADPEVNRSFVEKILRNADRLTNLTNDITEISRIETGELKMTMAPFDLRRVARDVVELLEPIASENQVALRGQIPETLPPVLGDGNRIRQVLINLIENAIKYNNPGGQVELIARLTPTGEVKVSVVDDGIGLAPEHIARLTERFYRVDKSRSRSQGGTGLGLAIVKHILGAHDRTLMVESRPDQGSTFAISLPTIAPAVSPPSS